MNRKQKIISLVGLILIVLVGLIPPWKLNTTRVEQPIGHHLIFSPPAMEQEEEGDTLSYSVDLDIPRLIVQWVLILFATAVLLFLTKGKVEKHPDVEFWE